MESARRSEKQRYPVLYGSLKDTVRDWVCITIPDILSKNPKHFGISNAAAQIHEKLNNSILSKASSVYTPFNQFYNLRGELEYANESICREYQLYRGITSPIFDETKISTNK